MNKLYFYLFSLLILSATSTVNSATFCVGTSAELTQALNTADGNNQADIIKIKTGTYMAPPGGFHYYGSSENHGLEISGGWTFSTCSSNLNHTPFETVLDGDSLTRILYIRAGATTDNFKVSNLAFINGLGDDSSSAPFNYAGGLWMRHYGNFSGDFILERCAFINNEAEYASALIIENGINSSSRTTVRNNLFIGNHAAGTDIYGQNTVSLKQDKGLGVYFTNNTVISNTATITTNVAGLLIQVLQNANAYVANNILWDNDGSDVRFIDAGDATIYSYNNNIGHQTGTVNFSANNISIPPLFEEVPLFSFNRIPAADSQMVDVGVHPPFAPPVVLFLNDWQLSKTDFLGNPRVQGIKVDMGAFEATPPPDLIFANGFE